MRLLRLKTRLSMFLFCDPVHFLVFTTCLGYIAFLALVWIASNLPVKLSPYSI